MEIFILWFVFSLVIGFMGTGKNVGFWGGFLASLLLSPLLGLIIVMVSKKNEPNNYDKSTHRNQDAQPKNVSNISYDSAHSISGELQKLKAMRDQNEITEEEFQKLKTKVINS